MLSKLKKLCEFLNFLEKERIKSMIYTGSSSF